MCRIPQDMTSLSAFESVTELNADGAREIIRHYCNYWLLLPAVTDLPADVAAILAAHRGGLVLNRVATLTTAAATGLGRAPGPLELKGLESISADVAAALAGVGGELSLDGLGSIDRDVAVALAARGGPLSLLGLEDISRECAAVFGAHSGKLSISLRGAAADDVEVLEGLAARDGGCLFLSFPVPQVLTIDMARALRRHRGELELFGVTAMSPEAASQLATRCPGVLRLPSLQKLDAGVASAFSAWTGLVIVTNAEDIEPGAFDVLRQSPRIKIPARWRPIVGGACPDTDGPALNLGLGRAHSHREAVAEVISLPSISVCAPKSAAGESSGWTPKAIAVTVAVYVLGKILDFSADPQMRRMFARPPVERRQAAGEPSATMRLAAEQFAKALHRPEIDAAFARIIACQRRLDVSDEDLATILKRGWLAAHPGEEPPWERPAAGDVDWRQEVFWNADAVEGSLERVAAARGSAAEPVPANASPATQP